jgi:hypothetical protein
MISHRANSDGEPMSPDKRKRLIRMLNNLDTISFSNWEYEHYRYELMEKIRAQLRADTNTTLF